MPVTAKDIIDFFVVTVLIKYVFVHGIVSIMNFFGKLVYHYGQKKFVTTERDRTVYTHYRNAHLKKSK